MHRDEADQKHLHREPSVSSQAVWKFSGRQWGATEVASGGTLWLCLEVFSEEARLEEEGGCFRGGGEGVQTAWAEMQICGWKGEI